MKGSHHYSIYFQHIFSMPILLLFAFYILSNFSKYNSFSNLMSSYEEISNEMKSRVMHNICQRKFKTTRTTNMSMAITDTSKIIIPNFLTMSLYSSKFVNVTQYLLNRNNKKTFIFKPKPRAGVANNLRSIRGLMMISMANNANFCIKYPDFFTIMDDSFSFLKCPSSLKTVQWKHDYAVNWTKRGDCNYHINHSVEIQTSDDLSSSFYKCRYFIKDIKVNSHIEGSKSLYPYLSNYIFKPKKYIVDYAESVLKKMQGVKVGIQLRFGGNTAASKEKEQFLNPNSINFYIDQILNVTSKINSRYTLFLSTDSPSIQKSLSPLNATIVIADKYSVGHTNRYQLQFLQRAITDIYILSRCDILLHSQGSSYGSFASAISAAKADYLIMKKQSYVCSYAQRNLLINNAGLCCCQIVICIK